MPNDPNDVSSMVRDLQRRIQAKTLDSGMGQAGRTPGPESIPCDLVETPDAYHLTMDLPGIRREDIRIAVKGRRVQVTAAPKPTAAGKGQQAVMVERSGGTLNRSIELPGAVNEKSMSMDYVTGVLSVVLKKV